MIEHGYKVWFNGAVVPEREAQVPAASRAVSYGDGCFETLRGRAGKFVCFGEHVDRLHAGMEYLGISQNKVLKKDSLISATRRLLEINHLASIHTRIRIQVWRSGIAAPDEEVTDEASVLITARPHAGATDPLALVVSPIRRIPASALDNRFKLSNYMNYILAGREARERGADDALMLTIRGEVSECSVANIFWLKEGVAYTPSVRCDPLPGITRDLTLRYLKMQGITADEGSFMPDHLNGADAVWVCNSVKDWQTVRSIGDKTYPTGHAEYRKLQTGFQAYLKTLLT
jgi:branched-subunit amino acid aminotransferase/4-amino-4-deoxychorismate lyase